MASRFIRYTPDIEVAEPQFDEKLKTVIAKTESYIAASVTAEGTGRAVRDAHAKGYGSSSSGVPGQERREAGVFTGTSAGPGR